VLLSEELIGVSWASGARRAVEAEGQEGQVEAMEAIFAFCWLFLALVLLDFFSLPFTSVLRVLAYPLPSQQKAAAF
jgi:hypothetical protein